MKVTEGCDNLFYTTDCSLTSFAPYTKTKTSMHHNHCTTFLGEISFIDLYNACITLALIGEFLDQHWALLFLRNFSPLDYIADGICQLDKSWLFITRNITLCDANVPAKHSNSF